MTFLTNLKKKYIVAAKQMSVGDRVQIAINSGTLSGKKGVVIDKNLVKTDGRGVPTNIPGAYKPVDWNAEVAIQLDDGQLVTMFKNRVRPAIEADWNENEGENEDQSEDDAYFAPSGYLGSKTSLSIEGKHIGEFKSDKEAELAFVAWVNKHHVYPNTWFVSDHGNIHRYKLSDENSKKIKM